MGGHLTDAHGPPIPPPPPPPQARLDTSALGSLELLFWEERSARLTSEARARLTDPQRVQQRAPEPASAAVSLPAPPSNLPTLGGVCVCD